MADKKASKPSAEGNVSSRGDKSKTTHKFKPSQTIRQKSATANKTQKGKTRHIKQAGKVVRRPISKLFDLITRLLRPFRFLLVPFKTRPARFIGRILSNVLLLKYFRNSWKELRQVTWPDRRETTRLTIAVILFAVFFGLLISVVDYGLDKVFEKLIIK